MDICDRSVFLQDLSAMDVVARSTPRIGNCFANGSNSSTERLVSTYLRFLHAWQLSCGLSRRLEYGGRDLTASSAPGTGRTLSDRARCFGKVIVRAVFGPG